MKISIPSLALLTLIPFSAALAETTAKKDEKSDKKPASRCCTVLPKGEIKNPVFLKQNTEKKEIEIFIIATFDKSNYGMNFNGISKSEGGYEVPLGWKVMVTFCNNSDVPHSVMVVEADIAERKINLGDTPYFDGAATPKPNTLGTTSTLEKFEFTPDEVGDFSFACGFPTHSANGHRIFLKIKKDLKQATFIVPNKKKPDAK